MLPKIPYIMEKNKSMTIPVGNLNLSSNFRPGDIADSYGISARRYPQLTNSKDKSLVYTGGNILGMTVFNGEIVTVRAEVVEMGGYPVNTVAIYVGANRVAYLGSDYRAERQFAVINTKLVVYPDKIYLEQVNGKWQVVPLSEAINPRYKKVFFTENTISISESFKRIEGYGGTFENNSYSGEIALEPKALESGTYLFGKNGYVTCVEYYGEVTLTCKDGNFTITTNANYPAIKTGYSLYCVTDDRMYVGTDYTVSQSENGGYTAKGKLSDDGDAINIENLSCSLYYRVSGRFFGLKGDKNISIKDASGEEIICGTIRINTGSVLDLTMESPNKRNRVLTGNFKVLYLGWQSEDVQKISAGDVVYFDSDEDRYTVSTVTINTDVETFEITFNETVSDSTTVLPAKSRVSITKYTDYFSGFKKGDAITISGSSFNGTDDYGRVKTFSNDMALVILDIKDDIIYTSADIFTPHTFENGIGIAIERKSPSLDFICEKDNRLYGVNNSEKTIYVSALGDPTNMYAYEGVSTDSFAVAVGGEGDFTGCCKYAESVLFFKEDKIYKLVGSYPAEFALYSYDVDGLDIGSEKSPAVINEVLYYKGKNGVFAYTGGIPSLISENFGEKNFSNAAGGSDGVCYYLAAKDEQGVDKLLSFNTRLGLWVLENAGGDEIIGFAKTSAGLHYATSDGEVYKLHGSEKVSENWMVQFVPFYETIEGKKTYSRLLMRAELPRDSYMIIEVRSDDGPWCEAGKIVGANKGIIPIRLPIARCDKFEIRLRGRGEFVLHDILREYHVGSEV